MLREALQGRSPGDAGWWADPKTPVTEVAVNEAGAVVGVVSYALRPKDDTGQLLWLHCQEYDATADALIGPVVAVFVPRRVRRSSSPPLSRSGWTLCRLVTARRPTGRWTALGSPVSGCGGTCGPPFRLVDSRT
ncbi:hypothetical protein [Streptomyces sp. NPDC054975]